MPNLFNKSVRLFLDSIGQRDEYEFYLRKFHENASPVFALLCPYHEAFEDAVAVFRFDLELLTRLELTPLILLCGDHAVPMSTCMREESDSFRLLTMDDVRDPAQINVKEVEQFARQCHDDGIVPVVSFAHLSLPQSCSRLVPELCRRLHIIRPKGMLTGRDGVEQSYHYTRRPHQVPVVPDDQWIVSLADQVLRQVPSAHVSVASSWNLLQELFTVRGAGCVIRRGSVICRYDSVDQVDVPRLVCLLEDSFRKKLVDETQALSCIRAFYIDKNYCGAGLLEETLEGMYLSKFAVGTEARGEGLAQELWHEMCHDHPRLFWRARISNPINSWYEKQAHGYFNDTKWRVFWRNIEASHISAIIQYSLNRPEDFVAG
ncbi:MAG: hypothetical protein EOL87_01255 [Spartobacteria bacterium]|nr:hypothetical protein [Spartobacteria bacterium]